MWRAGPTTTRPVRSMPPCATNWPGSTWSLPPPCCAPFYVARWGRPAYPPEALLRSLVAMVLAGYTSISAWVALLRSAPFYCVVAGLDPHQAPAVGTFYTFLDRLLGGRPQPARRPVRRLTPTHKAALRAEKKQPGARHLGVVTRLVQALRAGGRRARRWAPSAAERRVNALLGQVCIQPAVQQGLLLPTVGVSGDSMKLATFSNSYGQKACACPERGCGCPRRFTDPDASTGYDAHHHQYVFGHTLYQLTAWSPGRTVELPIYLLRATGARSDAVLGPLAVARARAAGAITFRQVCADGAHDAYAFYELAAAWDLALFIPLSSPPRKEAPGGEGGLARDGTPLCRAGRRMVADGYQPEYRRYRWRCPLKKGPERGDVTTCPHWEACSPAQAGRVVYTRPADDLRVHCVPPRGTLGWQQVYDHRTASERTNSRQGYHLKLKQTRTRGGHRWLFRALLCAMAQYALAWHQHQPLPACPF
jgi:hypothetical protein